MDSSEHNAAATNLLSVLVPVCNEQEALSEFHRRLICALSDVDMGLEVLYVNDGSTDGSVEVLRQLRARDQRVGVLDLSRNVPQAAP